LTLSGGRVFINLALMPRGTVLENVSLPTGSARFEACEAECHDDNRQQNQEFSQR
jgi:hypothetical protein